MNAKNRLIILNGFSGSGKSTIAQKYIEEHPLAMNVEGDEIMAMIGGWKSHYAAARKCIFPITKALISTHLNNGYDVVVPYLLVDSSQTAEFELLAEKLGVKYFEIMLANNKGEAIGRLMERGRWGEEGLPKLTKKDIPHIEDLYDRMVKATAERPNTINIYVKHNDIEDTYSRVLEVIK